MPRTVVGPETRVGGPLTGKDEIVVEGTVDGPVTGDATVTILAGARVAGEVRGKDVIVGGVMQHAIFGASSVHLLATAEVYADIHAPRIAIDDGAICEGALKMGRKRGAAAEQVNANVNANANANTNANVNASEPAKTREIPSLPAIGKRRLVRR